MKKFITKILWLAIPFVLGFVGLEVFYRLVPNNYTVKYQNIQKQAQRIEVLLLGDSHCLYGLNPKYFTRPTFNLSQVSQTLYFDQLLLDRYLDHLPQLRQVVFCIEYTNLSQADNSGDDSWRKFYYQKFMHLQVPIIHWADPRNYFLSCTQNFYKSRDLVKRYIKTRTIVDCDAQGWGINYTKAQRIPPASVARQRALVQEDGSMDFSVNQNRLDAMLQKCRQRNLQVLIVSMPQTLVYEHLLNPVKLEKIKQTCAGFQQKYPQNVRYLNLFDDSRFTEEDFYDADHLNDQGAIKCSQIVNAFLQQRK